MWKQKVEIWAMADTEVLKIPGIWQVLDTASE